MNPADLAQLVEPAVVEEGYELVECNVSRTPRSQVFRFYIDAEGGVPIDACARVSRRISQALDANPLLQGNYLIEVSSPGMNRRIWTRAHFLRFRGERAKVDLRGGEGSERVRIGSIGEVGETDFELLLEGGGTQRIDFAEIEIARLRLDPWKRTGGEGPKAAGTGTRAGSGGARTGRVARADDRRR